ncbi:hypothetical protein S40293_02035 [Stachybotrys chartarum IBT 40293]|nr:hypothetical protein S40293_02035 [Stachybotrys chartarum IBT 40293]
MPPRSHLALSPTPRHRSRRATNAYNHDDDVVAVASRSRRQPTPDSSSASSPDCSRPMRPTEISEPSSEDSSSNSASDEEGKNDDDDDDNNNNNNNDPPKDILEEADDEASRDRAPRNSSREDYLESSDDRGARHRRRHRRRSPVEQDRRSRHRRRHHSESDPGSPDPRPPWTPDADGSRRKDHRHRVPSVLEDSRPPVASKRTPRHAHRSAETVQQEPGLTRAHTMPSSRGSHRSTSRPRSLFGSFFGAPTPPRAPPVKPAKLVECVVCMGDLPTNKVAKLKCGHRMCNSCLQRSFRLSIADPQHMPPKCCTQDLIPLKHVERLFDDNFKKTWNRKFAEFSTRNRIYCPAKKCGEWIKPHNIHRENGRRVARCGRCKTKVCGTCNGKWHSGAECPKDEETNLFLEQAKDEGWQRCYRCKAVVELKEGCNHMTCRCGAEFCMICGVKWKNCDCPWFNYGAVEADRLEHMNEHVRGLRGNHRDAYPGEPELGSRMAMHPRPRPPPPGTYEEEMYLRQVREERDADLARHMQLYDEDEDDVIGDVVNILGIGGPAGHYTNDDYRYGGRSMAVPSQVYPAPPMYEGHMPEASRARTRRGGSLEQRLADRLSENRQGIGPRPMGSSISPHAIPHPMGSPIGMPPPIGMPMMSPPPPVPMLRAHTMEAELYNSAHSTPRSERIVPARMSRHYEDEVEVHAPRSRRRSSIREEVDEPPSSTLAGLTGPGRGMNRVFEWRNFVEPGAPEDEVIAARASDFGR